MKKKKNSLVWQFYKETDMGGSGISYLIGTMHVRDQRAFQFEPVFFEKILACDIFATEFDLDDTQAYAISSALMLPFGTTLETVIPPGVYNRIHKVMKKQTGIGLEQFKYLKPIAVSNFLSEFVLSNDRMLSLDESLWQFAKANNKILRGIETFDEQLEILQKMPIDDQVKALKEVVRHFPKFRQQLLNMANLYENADIEQLFKMAQKTAKGGRKLLLYERNELMTKRILECAGQQTICAAVGAGHLAGKKGILRLLKQQGFKVKPA